MVGWPGITSSIRSFRSADSFNRHRGSQKAVEASSPWSGRRQGCRPCRIASWWDYARDAADGELAIRFRVIDIDLMAYRMIQDARSFDVIA